MEIIEKAMERRGASIVWAGRGYTLKGETPVRLERIQGSRSAPCKQPQDSG